VGFAETCCRCWQNSPAQSRARAAFSSLRRDRRWPGSIVQRPIWLRDDQKAAAIVGQMFRWPFRYRDGARRQATTGSADDSALRECDESRGTRCSERHSAHKDAGSANTRAWPSPNACSTNASTYPLLRRRHLRPRHGLDNRRVDQNELIHETVLELAECRGISAVSRRTEDVAAARVMLSRGQATLFRSGSITSGIPATGTSGFAPTAEVSRVDLRLCTRRCTYLRNVADDRLFRATENSSRHKRRQFWGG
jgi:hypothetical protein